MLAYQDTIITSLENEFQSFFILLRDHTGYPKNKGGRGRDKHIRQVYFKSYNVLPEGKGHIGPPPSYAVCYS